MKVLDEVLNTIQNLSQQKYVVDPTGVLRIGITLDNDELIAAIVILILENAANLVMKPSFQDQSYRFERNLEEKSISIISDNKIDQGNNNLELLNSLAKAAQVF